ncbi:MAG TPA: molybdenum cofactor biosynthesis protein MoaE [Solirubrobacterales bacterium]|jgi:molybdopterin synthase catalytic subunit|nr:molybdenum cofactor biosynthesis protein MoaE [Solirubrobacterales bacterium]
MILRVRLFAILRERAGRDTIDIQLAEGATVAEAMRALASESEPLGAALEAMPVVMAVNRSYADADTSLGAGDELALIPPVSGGAVEPPHVRVGPEPLSPERLTTAVATNHTGAIVTFHGTTRDVDRLEYEAYEPMASERIATILDRVAARHKIEGIAAEHRTGEVPLGEPSVLIAVAAAHRDEAFAAAREAIDRIKAEAPIWKREVEGDAGRWVDGTSPAL